MEFLFNKLWKSRNTRDDDSRYLIQSTRRVSGINFTANAQSQKSV